MKSKRTKLLLLGLIVSGFGAAVASAGTGSTETDVNEQSIAGYHNVALNRGGDYPKASASNEYNPLFFGAHNVINGQSANKGHGKKYPSWGPHKRDDLWLKIEFGKPVAVDKAVVYIRADFTPYTNEDHDSYWKSGVLEFSDGSKLPFELKKTDAPQTIVFSKRKVSWVKFTSLVPDEDKWCGFTEVQFWGNQSQ